ncbi:MAG: FGGY-family carbohydrate kinase [Cypionkella sp.]
MTPRHVLAIDQGTTNTKALLVSDDGAILARAASPLVTLYPHPGWAEQSAEAIWASVQDVIAKIVESAGVVIDCIAITNQRETLVVWDARTSEPICPAIIWQCRRTAAACEALVSAGHNARVETATGLAINPLFPASKLAWVLENVAGARALADAGHLRAGTVDTWLLWKMTGGASFATDHSNASRTQLFDTEALKFSPDLCSLFQVPISCLPTPLPSDATFGQTAAQATVLPAGIPIKAMMGDSHAALFGHGVRTPGTVKATYGTGSSLMTLTPKRVRSGHGLSGTIAWTNKDGTAHALEGNITVSAQAAAFMRNLLSCESVTTLGELAQTVPDSGGVVFVPALAGLGAPHWDDRATGTITGMTHATGPAHLARATFDGIAHQIADVFGAMELDIGHRINDLRADGGASVNGFLMQLQADLLGRRVQRSEVEELGALGVAAMALGHDLPASASAMFEPAASQADRDSARASWAAALVKVRA